MRKILLNKINLPHIPGNIRLIPNLNTYGFYEDRTVSEGSVRTRKGKFLGRFDKIVYDNGNIIINISI